jgi:hypothetical protein
MPTTKREVRIPDELWFPSMSKAQGQGTSTAGVIKILLAAYLTGSLDDLVAEAVREASTSTANGSGEHCGQAPAPPTG